jgi:hypothetical protein
MTTQFKRATSMTRNWQVYKITFPKGNYEIIKSLYLHARANIGGLQNRYG